MIEQDQTAEFITKLAKMVQNGDNVICWNDTQTEIVIKDPKKMAEKVIPAYFRHAKYQSFVRQLNMYNFHKVCRQKNNTINFKNDIFFRGNQGNFNKIKRKKKHSDIMDNKACEDQLKYIKSNPSIPHHFKELLLKLISYKVQVLNHNSKIKSFFVDVNNDLKTPKFKRYDKDVQEIKHIMDQIQERSTKIDELFVSSQKLSTQSQFQSYQERLDEGIDNPSIKARIIGIHDEGNELFDQRYPEQNNFPRFTTKVSFINIVDVPDRENWGDHEEDRLSMCSIEDDLQS